MKKKISYFLLLLVSSYGFAQDVKIKKGEITIDGKLAAYIEGKKPAFIIYNIDKTYTVSAELKKAPNATPETIPYIELKNVATGKFNEIEFKVGKFSPFNHEKNVVNALIDENYLDANGLNQAKAESFINGAPTNVATKAAAAVVAIIEKKNRIASYKVTVDDNGAIFSPIAKSGTNNYIGMIKITGKTSMGIQKYEVYDLDGILTATWYNMSSRHPGFDGYLYQQLITRDGKVFAAKEDNFGNSVNYKMSLDKTTVNIVNELIDNGYTLQHQGQVAEKNDKVQIDQLNAEKAAASKVIENKIYEQKPFAMDKKAAIRVIEYMLEAHSIGDKIGLNSTYILEKNQTIGKRYPGIGNISGVTEIRLNIENNLIKNAVYISGNTTKPILLEFQGDHINRIIYKDLSIDFKLSYAGNTITIVSKESASQSIYTLEVEGDQTKSIVKSEKLDQAYSEPYISYVTKITYADKSRTIATESYKSNKKLHLKFTEKLTDLGNKVYLIEKVYFDVKDNTSNALQSTYYYDAQDRVAKAVHQSKSGSMLETFFYDDSKSINYTKRISLTEHNNVKSAMIDIIKDMPKPSADAPIYEWQHGEYQFDATNTLIFEGRDGQMREKINNVWSPWRNREM